jgi:hypothetical protein
MCSVEGVAGGAAVPGIAADNSEFHGAGYTARNRGPE